MIRLPSHQRLVCRAFERPTAGAAVCIAAGVPADTVAPAIREREREIAKLDAKLRGPRPGRPNIDKLREALTLRAAEWRKTLREEPKVARVLLRRLVVPLTLVDPEDFKAFIEWETSLTPAILEGLAPIYR